MSELRTERTTPSARATEACENRRALCMAEVASPVGMEASNRQHKVLIKPLLPCCALEAMEDPAERVSESLADIAVVRKLE